MNTKTYFTIAQSLSVMGLLLCGNAVAQDARVAAASNSRNAKTVVISDVALQNGSVLVGQYLQPNGKPYADSKVALMQNGKIVHLVETNKDGQFSVRAKAGVYEIQTDRTASAYRLWAPDTAPPAAKKGVVIVADQDVVRGQFGDMSLGEGAIIGGAAAGGIIAGAAAGAFKSAS